MTLYCDRGNCGKNTRLIIVNNLPDDVKSFLMNLKSIFRSLEIQNGSLRSNRVPIIGPSARVKLLKSFPFRYRKLRGPTHAADIINQNGRGMISTVEGSICSRGSFFLITVTEWTQM